ncbi:MAG: pyridoxal-phosphate dependent enzyme [Xanthomonadales bacterium]|jgi:threonine synthase|nr:pyridoxal-phosphate dependent enzyme [Xanthomonadales bacterium]
MNNSAEQKVAAERALLLSSSAPETPLPAETVSLANVAADVERDLDERLEAYEDIIDSEVGDTDIFRARNTEREDGLRQIFMKFEGSNPSGTQKDRIAFAQAQDALRRGFDTVTVATCGNYGAAVAQAAALAGLRCVIFIPAGYKTRRETEMRERGAVIERVSGDYENAVEVSRNEAERREYYDANPGGANLDLQLRAYGAIASEIYDDLRDAPAAVAVPVSNGTTLAGIYRGFKSLYRRGKTSRIPRMVAGSSYGKNPIVAAWLKGLDTCEDLLPGHIRETSVNEPLINWHSIDGDLAIDAIRESGGWATYASDKALMARARAMREQQGLNVLPASTAGLHALLSRHQKETLPNDRYVVILTGRK